MPSINLRKDLYDELVKRGYDPVLVANTATQRYLDEKKREEEEVKKVG